MKKHQTLLIVLASVGFLLMGCKESTTFRYYLSHIDEINALWLTETDLDTPEQYAFFDIDGDGHQALFLKGGGYQAVYTYDGKRLTPLISAYIGELRAYKDWIGTEFVNEQNNRCEIYYHIRRSVVHTKYSFTRCKKPYKATKMCVSINDQEVQPLHNSYIMPKELIYNQSVKSPYLDSPPRKLMWLSYKHIQGEKQPPLNLPNTDS